jgi:hypothetical protein
MSYILVPVVTFEDIRFLMANLSCCNHTYFIEVFFFLIIVYIIQMKLNYCLYYTYSFYYAYENSRGVELLYLGSFLNSDIRWTVNFYILYRLL